MRKTRETISVIEIPPYASLGISNDRARYGVKRGGQVFSRLCKIDKQSKVRHPSHNYYFGMELSRLNTMSQNTIKTSEWIILP